jgi:hypothetical protein|tara:strand:+ start:141 stop:869 length:729 start_codon:yes stop_codon:yes gene_type:complete
MSEFKFPTEEVELPSKGLVYPKDHPLSSGKVEIKYMTAKEEDILSNQSFIQKGIVLEKLLRSVIVNKDINVDDLIIGDKNSLLIATRILGYGKEYKVTIAGQEETIDLTELENREFDEDSIKDCKNEFVYTLPSSGAVLTYKIITGRDEKAIDRELSGLKKINKESDPSLSTRLKFMVLSIDGNEDRKFVREYVDNLFLARDSRAFRTHVADTQPDVDLKYITESGEEVTVPIGLTFFWPDF